MNVKTSDHKTTSHHGSAHLMHGLEGHLSPYMCFLQSISSYMLLYPCKCNNFNYDFRTSYISISIYTLLYIKSVNQSKYII